MKLLTEYLEHAVAFERMASEENNPEVRAQFEDQAVAYRKLAADRATRYGLPAPSPPDAKKREPNSRGRARIIPASSLKRVTYCVVCQVADSNCSRAKQLNGGEYRGTEYQVVQMSNPTGWK
jgi:hypothetical protein